MEEVWWFELLSSLVLILTHTRTYVHVDHVVPMYRVNIPRGIPRGFPTLVRHAQEATV